RCRIIPGHHPRIEEAARSRLDPARPSPGEASSISHDSSSLGLHARQRRSGHDDATGPLSSGRKKLSGRNTQAAPHQPLLFRRCSGARRLLLAIQIWHLSLERSGGPDLVSFLNSKFHALGIKPSATITILLTSYEPEDLTGLRFLTAQGSFKVVASKAGKNAVRDACQAGTPIL